MEHNDAWEMEKQDQSSDTPAAVCRVSRTHLREQTPRHSPEAFLGWKHNARSESEEADVAGGHRELRILKRRVHRENSSNLSKTPLKFSADPTCLLHRCKETTSGQGGKKHVERLEGTIPDITQGWQLFLFPLARVSNLIIHRTLKGFASGMGQN